MAAALRAVAAVDGRAAARWVPGARWGLLGAMCAAAARRCGAAMPARGLAVAGGAAGSALRERMRADRPPRRVLFNVPGSDERKVRKALGLDLDNVVLDLEDGVAASRKAEARAAVAACLASAAFGRAERLVRMNAVGSGLELEDLAMLADASATLDGVVLPKAESSEQVEHVVAAIGRGAARSSPVRVLAAIESATALLNLADICAHPHVDALIFASEDYCADVGITRTRAASELLYARGCIVTHAAAHRLDAIDMVCIDFKDALRLREEALEGARMGFTGKQAIHPDQVPHIYDAFRPSEDVVSFAREIVAGFEQHSAAGTGAFEVRGKMIDLPMYKWAQRVLARAL